MIGLGLITLILNVIDCSTASQLVKVNVGLALLEINTIVSSISTPCLINKFSSLQNMNRAMKSAHCNDIWTGDVSLPLVFFVMHMNLSYSVSFSYCYISSVRLQALHCHIWKHFKCVYKSFLKLHKMNLTFILVVQRGWHWRSNFAYNGHFVTIQLLYMSEYLFKS